MKVGALILGILGGLIALLYGFAGYAFGGIGGSLGLQIVSIAVPIVALVGAGMVMQKPVIGSVLMALAAIVLVLLLGFNIASLIPFVLLGIAAFLGYMGSRQEEIVRKTT
jgi:hypothetical protein